MIQIGDIRYVVYTGKDKLPWVSRVEVIRISPKGHSIRFRALDTLEPHEFSEHKNDLPATTELVALRRYQEGVLKRYALFYPDLIFADETPQSVIKKIVTAAVLIKQCKEKFAADIESKKELLNCIFGKDNGSSDNSSQTRQQEAAQ
jgi:hypothetical protein